MLSIPRPTTYVVAEIDIDATLRHVGDPRIRWLLEGIRPVKALLFLDMAIQLPLPTTQACTYDAHLVGPGLRPQSTRLPVLTPEMSIPIFSSTTHPTGREALHSDPPFPLSGCYHWLGPDMEMKVRIRTTTDDNDDTQAGHDLPLAQRVRLLAPAYAAFHRSRWEDIETARNRFHAHKAAENTNVISESGSDAEHDLSGEHSTNDSVPDAYDIASAVAILFNGNASTTKEDVSDETQEQALGNLLESPDNQTRDYAELLTSMNVFGLEGELNPNRYPVLRVWYDLAAHVDANAIPDPLIFANQCDIVTRILQRDAARKPELNPPAFQCGQSVGECSQSTPPGATRWRKFKGLTHRAMRTFRRIFCKT